MGVFMKVIVGKNSGFCAGVKRTITKAEEELTKSEKALDCLGEIIHNKQVLDSLSKKGLRIIDSIEDAKDKVIIRAHGVNKEVYDYAKNHEISLIDLTCPKVLHIHEQVLEASNSNFFIFLLGIKTHPETVGTFSYCSDNSFLIETIDDISPAIEKLKSSKLTDVFIISQTTFNLKLFNEITEIITKSLSSNFNICIQKSICNATELRQKEANSLSSEVQLMIIIGGKNSSNTKKLYEVSKLNCKNVLHIETKSDLDLEFVKQFNHIGIMAGASTPDIVTKEVVDVLETL